MAVIVSKELQVRAPWKILSDFAHGEIVKLNENGTPVEFYVAKHDYESGLNGAGRTLLVRKDCYGSTKFNNSTTPSNCADYDGSLLDTTLVSYKAVLDADVQNAVGTTKFYCRSSSGAIEREIFTLSATEVGMTGLGNYDGSVLPIASILQIAKYNGSAREWWTRTKSNAVLNNHPVPVFIQVDGNDAVATVTIIKYYRPCFTLPANTRFDSETLEFMGVK